MPQTHTSIELKGIAAILREQRLQVPVHQRPFEWRQAEVQELLDDLHGAFDRAEEYFLGTAVITSADEPPQVLDGQQRLASVALIVAAIADKFIAVGDNERGTQMRTQYLTPFDIASGETQQQLALNRVDEPYFRKLINADFAMPEAGAPNSHELLHSARTLTAEWVSAKSNEAGDAVRWLTDFTKFLTDSAKVILVRVFDDANAFLIFETLNARGLDLSIADLLKNYLLGHAGDDLPVVLDHWTRSLASLNAYASETVFTGFLRHFWSSKYSVVREKELYRDIKARIVTRPHVVDFSEELASNSPRYAAILSSDHEFWSEATPETREAIHDLQVLGLEQYRPMLLAALVHLDLPEIQKVAKLLISWNVRLLVVGGLGGGVMERNYSELGRLIRSGQLKNAQELSEAATFIPSDQIFRGEFAVARVSKAAHARYYLKNLEGTAKGEEVPETAPHPRLTLEHILPEQPFENWPQFSNEDAKSYLRRIGNMVLLTQPINSRARNSSFAEKHRYYEESELVLTKKIAEAEDWTPALIDERQEELAELAVQTWPLT